MNVEKAIWIASTFHTGQLDKADKPYIFHPLRVMLKMEEDGFNDDCLMVAVLHDIVEDTKMILEDLEFEGFQPHVVKAVDAITRRENETYKQYIQRCLENDIACAVKFYDSRHNLSRTAGLGQDFIDFMNERYGGTIGKIQQMLEEEPKMWDHLKNGS